MTKLLLIFLTFLSFLQFPMKLAYSQPVFKVIVLGCRGGPKEDNLSAYLIAPINSDNFVALDAGSLLEGISIAQERGSFKDVEFRSNDQYTKEAQILRNHIRAYLISHPHLDHVRGLVINSPIDSPKPIYGIEFTIDSIKDHLFNGKIWPNFGSEGKNPINLYSYQRMKLGQIVSIPQTEITAEPFLLSHPNGYQSTAYLIESLGNYVLYFGDTSPDAVEPKKHIEKVWKKIAPLIQQNKLKGIFLECSYDNSQPIKELYGHMTPHFMVSELKKLASLVDSQHPETALKDLKVVVTHIKESLIKENNLKEIIRQELEKINDLKVHFIFPEQGGRIEL